MSSWLRMAMVAALITVSSAPLAADAQRGGRLRANVFLVQQNIPGNLSEASLLGFARSHNARRLNETTEEPVPQRKWNADMIINFTGAPNDLEFHVLYYDVTEPGQRRFIDDMSTYVNDRSQKTYVQKIHLGRPRFRPNRRYEMVVTVHREEVGTVAFDTVGEEVHRSGTVDFSRGDDE